MYHQLAVFNTFKPMKYAYYSLLILIHLSIADAIQAQATQFLQTPVVDSAQGLSGQIYSLCYFQNNEYFSSPAPGRTYLGNRISAKLTYRQGLHYISTGALFQYQYGYPMRAKIWPLLTINYGINKFLKCTIGSLDGGANHLLPETVMGRGYLYQQPMEYGIQFRIPGKRISLDTWLDWRINTAPGDSIAEQFTQGTSIYYYVFHGDKQNIKLRGGALFYHHGGQALSQPIPVFTLMNYYLGAEGYFKLSSEWSLQLRYLFLAFNNPADNTPISWKNGTAHQIRIPLTYKNWTLGTGLFISKNYYAPFAGEIYSAKNLSQPDRKLLYGQIQWQSGALGRFNFQFSSEFFYSLLLKKMDYNYCVLMRFALPGYK